MTIDVGRVIRSSTARIAVGCQVLRPEVPAFGSLVQVRTIGGEQVFGLIHDLRMDDDPFVRQMAAQDDLPAEHIEDQRRNRLVPIEVGVLLVGFRREDRLYYHLPPQPPLSLDILHSCTPSELVAFTSDLDYFRLILDNRDLAADELLASHLRYAAEARGASGRAFLVGAGQELVRLLAFDLPRLDAMLRRIRP